jgi:hypothetical protein
MRRFSLPWLALLSLLLASCFAVTALSRNLNQGPVYSVAEVRAQLADNPGTWVGRTVRVRGLAEACQAPGTVADLPLAEACSYWPPDLHDPDPAAGATKPLPLVWGTQSPLLAWLRHVPLLSRLAPPASTPRWWALATYRVQLQRAPDWLCDVTPCYQALVLAAAL